jgi:hypothetical protein
MKSPINHLKRFREWSPTQKFSHQVFLIFGNLFALINERDFTLNQLLLNIVLLNRGKVKTKPDLPPYFNEVDVE